MRVRNAAIAAASLALSLSASTAVQYSADPKAKGREIAAESVGSDAGFGDTRSLMTMKLMSEGGDVSERTLRLNVLEENGADAGDKSIIVFDTPKDVQGTVLLTHTRILSADDQWIFIPAIARVKRISSANKAGPFLGSEFAYEDLTSQELAKYDYLWLKDEPCPAPDAALTCYVVQRTPLYENSGYKRQVAWIDAKDRQFRKVEYYNREDRLLKTLMLGKYRRYNDRFWRAHELMMVNHQTGRSTKLDVGEIKFKSGLTANDFTEQSMERLR